MEYCPTPHCSHMRTFWPRALPGWQGGRSEWCMSSTLFSEDLFHEPIGWSKAFAPQNIFLMSLTAEVSQESIGWLKTSAD